VDGDDSGGGDGGGFRFGEAIGCEAPVAGFARLADEAESRGLDFDQGEEDPEGTRACVLGSGVVAEDLDHDGDVDVLTRSGTHAPRIFANDGAGFFVEQADRLPSPRTERDVSAFGVLDLDGDALPELLMLGYGFAWIASNLGDLHWGDPRPLLDWEEAADLPLFLTATWGDVDGDGDLDVLLPTVRRGLGELGAGSEVPPGGVHYLLRNDGSSFVELAQLTPHGEPNHVQVATFTDRDWDGDQDLFLPSEIGWSSEPSAFFRNDGLDRGGSGVPLLVNDAEALGADIRPGAMGVDAVDASGDGRLDYCVSNVGPLMCLVSDPSGDGWFEAAVPMGLVPPQGIGFSDWSTWSVDFVDLDADGWEDFATVAGPSNPGNVPQQPDAVYQRNPEAGFVERSEEMGFDDERSHCAMAVADFAGDGWPDLLVTGDEGPPRLWMNPCGEAAWIEVELEGPAGNRLGLGARVTVEAGGRSRAREVYGLRAIGQGPSRLHFGLGESESLDRLEVLWPDGTVQEAMDVPARRAVTVLHPESPAILD
jgi:hypothetical protein